MNEREPQSEVEQASAPPLESTLPIAQHVARDDFNELYAQARQAEPAHLTSPDDPLRQDSLPPVTVKAESKNEPVTEPKGHAGSGSPDNSLLTGDAPVHPTVADKDTNGESTPSLQGLLPPGKPIEKNGKNPVPGQSGENDGTGTPSLIPPVSFPIVPIVNNVVAASVTAVKEQLLPNAKEPNPKQPEVHNGTGSPADGQNPTPSAIGIGSWLGEVPKLAVPASQSPSASPVEQALPPARPAESKVQLGSLSDVYSTTATVVGNTINQVVGLVNPVETKPLPVVVGANGTVDGGNSLQQLTKPIPVTAGSIDGQSPTTNIPIATSLATILQNVNGQGSPVDSKLPPAVGSITATLQNGLSQVVSIVTDGKLPPVAGPLPTIVQNDAGSSAPADGKLPALIVPIATTLQNGIGQAVSIVTEGKLPPVVGPLVTIAQNDTGHNAPLESKLLPVVASVATVVQNTVAQAVQVENKLPSASPVESKLPPVLPAENKLPSASPVVIADVIVPNRVEQSTLPSIARPEPAAVSVSLAKASIDVPTPIRIEALALVTKLESSVPRVEPLPLVTKLDTIIPSVESFTPGRPITIDLTARNEATVRENTIRGIAAAIDASGRIVGENISIRFQIGEKRGEGIAIAEGSIKITAGQPVILNNGVIIIKTKGDRVENDQPTQDGDEVVTTSNGIRINPILVNGSTVPTGANQDPAGITGGGMPVNVDPNQSGIPLPNVQIMVDPAGNQIIIVDPDLTPNTSGPQVAQADEGLVVATAGGWMIVPNGMLLNDWTIITPSGDQWVPNADGHYVPNTTPQDFTVQQQTLPEPPRESNDEKETTDAARRLKLEEENRRLQEELNAQRERAERIRRQLEEQQRRIQDALLTEMATKKTQIMIENEIRRKYTVREGDTLESIAEKQLKDGDLALLIYRVNKLTIKTKLENDRRVPQLRTGMVLYLPNMTDIVIFRENVDNSDFTNQPSQSAKTEAWERLFGKLGDEPAGARLRYTVRLGDSLVTLASRHPALNDASLWKLIAQINNLSIDTDATGKPLAILRRGSILILPTVREISEFRPELKPISYATV